MRLTVSEPLTSNLWATLEVCKRRGAGDANARARRGCRRSRPGLHPETAEAATAALQGQVLRTGTKLRASYRWQPRHLVTAVNPYDGVERPGRTWASMCGRRCAGATVASRARGHHRCDQPAGGGISAVPVGGWADAVPGAVSADDSGRAVVHLLVRGAHAQIKHRDYKATCAARAGWPARDSVFGRREHHAEPV